MKITYEFMMWLFVKNIDLQDAMMKENQELREKIATRNKDVKELKAYIKILIFITLWLLIHAIL